MILEWYMVFKHAGGILMIFFCNFGWCLLIFSWFPQVLHTDFEGIPKGFPEHSSWDMHAYITVSLYYPLLYNLIWMIWWLESTMPLCAGNGRACHGAEHLTQVPPYGVLYPCAPLTVNLGDPFKSVELWQQFFWRTCSSRNNVVPSLLHPTSSENSPADFVHPGFPWFAISTQARWYIFLYHSIGFRDLSVDIPFLAVQKSILSISGHLSVHWSTKNWSNARHYHHLGN